MAHLACFPTQPTQRIHVRASMAPNQLSNEAKLARWGNLSARSRETYLMHFGGGAACTQTPDEESL